MTTLNQAQLDSINIIGEWQEKITAFEDYDELLKLEAEVLALPNLVKVQVWRTFEDTLLDIYDMNNFQVITSIKAANDAMKNIPTHIDGKRQKRYGHKLLIVAKEKNYRWDKEKKLFFKIKTK